MIASLVLGRYQFLLTSCQESVRKGLNRLTHKSVDPAVRGAAYREGGWTSFDENAPAYTADQVAAERTRHVGSGV